MPPKPTRQTPATQVKTPAKPQGVLAKIRKIEFDEDDGIKLSVYGRSGTGKTTLWSSFPKPILAVIFSGGLNSGELRSIPAADRDSVFSIEPESLEEVGALITELEANNPYATIVLDHATGLQDISLRKIIGVEKLPVQKGWGLATQQQWGQCALQCKEVLRSLLNFSCNVIIVAQERNFNDESNSDIIMPVVGSALSPSVAGWLNAAVDYIGNTFIREKMEQVETVIGGKKITTQKPTGKVEYCLRTAPNSVYTTKFRVPKGQELPDVIIDPDYDKIMAVIRGDNV